MWHSRTASRRSISWAWGWNTWLIISRDRVEMYVNHDPRQHSVGSRNQLWRALIVEVKVSDLWRPEAVEKVTPGTIHNFESRCLSNFIFVAFLNWMGGVLIMSSRLYFPRSLMRKFLARCQKKQQQNPKFSTPLIIRLSPWVAKPVRYRMHISPLPVVNNFFALIVNSDQQIQKHRCQFESIFLFG